MFTISNLQLQLTVHGGNWQSVDLALCTKLINTKYQHTLNSHSKVHRYKLTISCDGHWIATVDIVIVVMTMFI